MATFRTKGWHRLGAVALLIALIAVVCTYAPARALARQFLAVFRVQQIEPIALEPGVIDQATIDSMDEWVERNLPQGPETVFDGAVASAATLEEASALAGFPVRLPAAVLGADEATIEVKGYTEFRMPFTREAISAFLQLAAMDPAALSPDLQDGEVRLSFASAAHFAAAGLEVLQVYRSLAEYPEGIDAQLLGEAALRIAGMATGDAARISQQVDWASTVVLPIPTDIAEFREVDIAGSSGVLIVPHEQDEDPSPSTPGSPAGSASENPVVLWQRDDVVYLVSGAYPPDSLLEAARSMF